MFYVIQVYRQLSNRTRIELRIGCSFEGILYFSRVSLWLPVSLFLNDFIFIIHRSVHRTPIYIRTMNVTAGRTCHILLTKFIELSFYVTLNVILDSVEKWCSVLFSSKPHLIKVCHTNLKCVDIFWIVVKTGLPVINFDLWEHEIR
jgi:hypothetical protein